MVRKSIPVQFLLLFAFLVSIALSGEMPEVDRQHVVARVGVGSIVLDQVLELWGPTWYEIVSRARREKLPAAKVNRLLQQSWEKSLDIALRDEIFYQEAVRSFDQQFRKAVDKYAAAKGPGSRAQVERDLKRMIDKAREEQVSMIIERNIKAAGGFDNLGNVLKNRGITFDIWKNRIIRKAYTYSYLYALFEPMGKNIQPSPRDVLIYYKSHREDFQIPGAVVFRHIFLSSKKRGSADKAYEAATKVYTEIADAKLDFAQAAQKYSDDKQSASAGGLERGVSSDPEREAWLSEVRQAASEQKIGELGPILISPRGCHLAQLISVGKPRTIPFSSAQKTILEKMRSNKWETQSQQLYKKLKQVVHVDILMPSFPAAFSWDNGKYAGYSRRIGFGADPTLKK